MYPYPRPSTEDEPTITDLRGVLPNQRPPIDPTVLEEPTSEVPIIRPSTDSVPDSEASTSEPVSDSSTSADLSSENGAASDSPRAAEDAETPDEADDDAEPDQLAQNSADQTTDRAQTNAEITDDADQPEPASAEPDHPTDATFADDPMTDAAPQANPISEMSKMTWNSTPASSGAPIVRDPIAPATSTPPDQAAEAADAARDDRDEVMAASAPPAADAATPEALTTTPEPEAAEPEAVEPAAQTTLAEPAGSVPAAAEPAGSSQGTPVDSVADAADAPIALWSPDDVERLRGQWRDLQVTFIDDPEHAVTGAKDLVTGAVQELANTLLEAQSALDPHRQPGPTDTEAMRLAMRRYREFLDRVLAL